MKRYRIWGIFCLISTSVLSEINDVNFSSPSNCKKVLEKNLVEIKKRSDIEWHNNVKSVNQYDLVKL